MSQPTPTRPRQVTFAAWLIMVGSAIVVAMVFDRVGTLHTLETRESVETFLDEPPGSGLSVGVDGIITLLRVVSMVTAGCATAAAILGYHVLRRSRSARLALTVIAVPLFLTGMVTGGFVSSVVAAAALMLWLQPSRDWFRDGGPAAPREGALANRMSASVDAPVPPAWPGSSVPQVPPAGSPYVPPPATSPYAAGSVSQQAGSARPSAVLRACLLTWIFSGLTAVGLVLSAVVLAVDSDALIEDVYRRSPSLAEEGVSDDLLVGVALAMIGALVVWCVGAAVLAALVLRRHDWARILLIISAGLAAAICLVSLFAGAFLLVLPLAAAASVILLLVRSDTNAWFRQR